MECERSSLATGVADGSVDQFRVAVIGCGYWGPNHVRVFEELLGPGTVVACEPDDAQRDRFARRFPYVPVYASPSEVLARSDVRAVVVATPAATHFALVGMALSAGKHVLCEKPFTRTVMEAQALEVQARATARVVMVGHVFLFNAGLQYVRRVCLDRTLGTLRYAIATRTNLGPVRTDVDVAADLASHDIAVLNWIKGSLPETVSAVGPSYIVPGHADAAFVTLSYPDGFTASMHASWLHPEKVRRLTVVGSERMLVWDDLHLESPVTMYDKHVEAHAQIATYGEFLRVSTHTGEVRHPFVPFHEPLKAQAQAFLDAIRDGGPVTSGADVGVGVMRVLDAVRHSMAARGAPARVAGD